jgi:hypothetical protein
MVKLIVAALLLVACGNPRRHQPVGSCTYKLVNGTCELKDITVGDLDAGGQPVHATYAWKGALPPGAEGVATRELEWRVPAAEVEALRARVQAKPGVACQLQLEGGPCPPTLVVTQPDQH